MSQPDTPSTTPHAAPGARAGSRSAARVTGVVVVGMSVAVWWPAFTLGAWGDFFFDQLLTIWAASTGALIVVLLQLRGRARVVRALALAVPSLWLVLSFVFDPDDSDIGSLVVTLLALLVGLLAIPTTIWVLARIIWPEFADEVTWRQRSIVIGAVAVIAAASFVLGLNQSRFLTCDDFTVSGNSEPPGCTPTPVDPAG